MVSRTSIYHGSSGAFFAHGDPDLQDSAVFPTLCNNVVPLLCHEFANYVVVVSQAFVPRADALLGCRAIEPALGLHDFGQGIAKCLIELKAPFAVLAFARRVAGVVIAHKAAIIGVRLVVTATLVVDCPELSP